MAKTQFANPIGQAWQRMTRLLFTPFDTGRWLVLSFSAWIATLGESSFQLSIHLPAEWSKRATADLRQYLRDALQEHLALWMVGSALLAIIILLAWLSLLWITSRFKCIFLSNVLSGNVEFTRAWHDFKKEGHSLFLWRLVFSLICSLIVLTIGAVGLAIAWPSLQNKTLSFEAVLGGIISSSILFVFVLTASFVTMCLTDFVLPLMVKHRLSTMQAWSTFLSIFQEKGGSFLLFGLMKFALKLVVTVGLFVVTVVTCCCAGYMVNLPYLGAVLLLPITVFFRWLGDSLYATIRATVRRVNQLSQPNPRASRHNDLLERSRS